MSVICLTKPDSNDPDKEPQMDKNDCYNTDVPKELVEARNTFIRHGGNTLREYLHKYTDEMVKYLLYVNGGGVVTILAFMGTSELIRNRICLQIALVFYAAGLVCVGILRAIMLRRTECVLGSWNNNVEKYYEGRIEYSELIEEHKNRAESGRIFWRVGLISGVLSFIGLILGGISMFWQC